MRQLALLLAFVSAACAELPPASVPATPPAAQVSAREALQETYPPRGNEPRRTAKPELSHGDLLLQGYIGANLFDEVQQDGGDYDFVDPPDLETMPLIGGGGQWVLGGGAIDYGIEAGIAFAFRTAGGAFIAGGGGAVVAVDVNLLLIDLDAGVFLSTFLGPRWRAYVAAGPLMEFADFQLDDANDSDGSGFGVGFYGRGGIEYVLGSRTMIGLGARWQDTSIDLDNGFGDLDVRGSQLFLTVTTGL